MTVYEIITLNKEYLELLDTLGIRTEHHKFVDLYRDYLQMEQNGDKKAYITSVLADRYGVGERTVYRAVRLMGRTVSLPSVDIRKDRKKTAVNGKSRNLDMS